MKNFRIDPDRETRLEFQIVRTPREPRKTCQGADEDCFDNLRVLLDGVRILDLSPNGNCYATASWFIYKPDATMDTDNPFHFWWKIDEMLEPYESRCLGSLIQRMLDCEEELVLYFGSPENRKTKKKETKP